jgi:XTP/dITP diphosphohydrolase
VSEIEAGRTEGGRYATETGPHQGLIELIDTVALLRAPGGCPWDADQTHESLVQYLVEECWELIDAIETGDRAEMIEELGDVLYQVLFHADLAAHTDGERFDIDDVARHMTAKMVSRHPHVFGDREAHTAADVVAFWDDLKQDEKPHRTSVLDGVPRGMPALALAQKMLGKAEKVSVTVADVPAPVDRETAVSPASESELGRLLLELVESARAQGIDAERALRGAVRDLEDQVRRSEQASSVEA